MSITLNNFIPEMHVSSVTLKQNNFALLKNGIRKMMFSCQDHASGRRVAFRDPYRNATTLKKGGNSAWDSKRSSLIF